MRLSGVLLHPTSLPSAFGIGDLGRGAYQFIDWLQKGNQKLWQVLPLGPTGYGDSPYASFSTFAGNPLLIDLDNLVQRGYLQPADLLPIPSTNPAIVDYGSLIPWKMGLLDQAALHFLQSHSPEEEEAYTAFCVQERWWLDDFALFMDIKNHFDALATREGKGGAIWSNYWPEDLALGVPKALEAWKGQADHRQTIERRKVIQYFFFTQWKALKKYANDREIAIIGDLPIFVAADSVDVWAHRELFQLTEKGVPKKVAGVPPDYFSETGQLWGNPLYDWPKHTQQKYTWWIQRIKGNLRLFDWLRIDHFRGFEAYWSVPYGESTAIHGTWEKAPGHDFFSQLKTQLGDLPILAEDLGFITEEVRDLRDSFALPGMKILQFAFDAKESGKGLDVLNGFLPHMYNPQSIVYTGTHDNDTLKGWLDKALPQELAFIRSYLGYTPVNYVEALIRLALSSVATFAIIPMQDILGLGSEARMNTPSTIGNNWKWRITENQLTDQDAEFIHILSNLYGRNV